MKTYLIPGLGFDHRIFKNLNLNGFQKEYIDWIEPKRKESIGDYAKRLAERVSSDAEGITLIGHSLGGIISQEIAKIRKIDQIILISSIKSRKENPFHFRIIRPLALHHFFTKKLTFSTFKYWAKKHDYESLEEQALFKDMVNQQSNHYLQWALKVLSNWQTPNLAPHTKVFQIHGAVDQTFPIKNITNPDRILKNGGHFMVYKHPEIISQIITDVLQAKTPSS